jgi:hypothetical protein
VRAGDSVGDGDGFLVLDDALGGDTYVGESRAHAGEEHSIADRAGDLSVGGVVVDAVRSDDLVKEVEFTCVYGFSELAERGLCGFFAHCTALPFLVIKGGRSR